MSAEWFDRATIYAIRHNPTGRIYVGRTKRLNDRLHQHFRDLEYGIHSSKEMQEDYNKYEKDYSLFILYDSFTATKYTPELRMLEKLFMTILQTMNPEKGYNRQDQMNAFSLNRLPEYKIDYDISACLDPRYKRILQKKKSERSYYIRIDEMEDGDEKA